MSAISAPIDLINLALTRCHVEQVASMDGDEEELDVAKRHYEPVLDDALARHAWTFASRTRSLTQSAITPPAPWSYAWVIPSEQTRIRWVRYGATAINYEMADHLIYTCSAGPLLVRYAYRPDEQHWPGDFVAGVSLKLAARIMAGVRDEHGEARNLEREGEAKLIMAMAADKRSQPGPAHADGILAKVHRSRGINGFS